MTLAANLPVVLFGAFDRHNFGDMLFPHIAASLLAEEQLFFAGLIERDLRPFGGHHVRALNDVVAGAGHPLKLIHAGGELLDCDAWEAAVMVSEQHEADAAIRQLDRRPVQRAKWAEEKLAMEEVAPYVVSRTLLPQKSLVHFHAVGGVRLNSREKSFNDEVIAKLKEADSVSVRDTKTQSMLDSVGITVEIVPDPAIMVARLFHDKIHAVAMNGEVGELCRRCPRGYIAVQCSADYADDSSVGLIAGQLDLLCSRTGLACVFFRAGAAPWHDSLECYHRIARRMETSATHIVTSLDLWSICAVISSSRFVCASSLHARIVAMSYGLPRLTFKHAASSTRAGALDEMTKHDAYLSTWELPSLHSVVPLDRIAEASAFALQADKRSLAEYAVKQAERHEHAFRTRFK